MLLVTTALLLSLGVLCQSRLRGGSTPEEVATRYVAAVRGGDRITLFVLSHPNAQLSGAFEARFEKYRGVAPGRIAITYEQRSIAYLMTVIVSIDGTRVDEVRLESEGRRWYIGALPD